MSIYGQLLSAALDETRAEHERSTVEAVTQLAACRSRLDPDLPGALDSDWASDAIADQLAYDIALIELARLLHIAVDLGAFGRSLTERARIEQALISRGVPIDQVGGLTGVGAPSQRKWGQR